MRYSPFFLRGRASFTQVVIAVCIMVAIGGCGGGGSDDGGSIDACSVLKVAGGEDCANPPRSIAIVATNQGYCTGTFLTPRHVLTAAHCFQRLGERVVVGTRGYAEDAVRFRIHPSYDGKIDSPFDVAVVTVGAAADVITVPIKLSQEVGSGDTVVTYGYGLDEDGLDVLRRVEDGGVALKATTLDVVDVDSGTVLTQSDGSGDTCQGDSGGAVILTGRNGEPGIVALVRAGPPGCVPDSGLPSSNTNVQTESVLNFILEQAPGTRTN